MNFEVRSNFLYFLSKLRICTYVLCYWPKHFISCDKTTNLSHDVWKAWNILRRTGLDISAHPLTQVSVKSVGRVQITLKLKTARSTTCATTLQANCSWSIRVPLVSWKLKWFLSGSESRWREKERKKPESCLWFKGLKGVREEQIEEVFSEMANWPAMVAAWSG